MFTPNHRQHLLVAFRNLDEALDDALRRLGASAGTPLFKRVHDDVAPGARKRACIAVAAVRDELRDFMTRHAMRASPPGIGATHAANAQLGLALVSAEELGPHHLRGYGDLDAEEASELEALSERLCTRIQEVIRALPEPPT